ncbi:MAG: glycosyltransferase family protein [Stygiobacter sp.]|uniref:Glycosyltransferase family protein n=1 Tax=Stygiobacter electus TaxID=3032292 RepID=A0AAE3TCZ5_9BACT|nr:glycosyltransferase family protein [Stygiobacter electus]MDF1611971.1 glycosyltransferase family protein [Stygiobacter electus]
MNNNSLKATAIIQARIGSTRLPKKIFLPLSGKPILWHVYQRVKKSKLIDNVIIATTDLPEDDLVEMFCIENKINYFRGSSDDVLSRYYFTAKNFQSDIIVRITSDCPLIDSNVIDEIIKLFISENADYASNVLERTFPRGYDTEVFSFSVLEKTFFEAKEKFEREHVTPFIYNHPEIFKLVSYKINKDYSSLRLTIDTQEDYNLIKIIYDSLFDSNNFFNLNDVINFLNKNPELIKINQHIEQKKLGE